MRTKSAGNHGALQAKRTDFQGLVFIPNTEKLLLWQGSKFFFALGALCCQVQISSCTRNILGAQLKILGAQSRTPSSIKKKIQRSFRRLINNFYPVDEARVETRLSSRETRLSSRESLKKL